MTSKTKYILFGVLGLGLAGGALVMCAALVIGIGYLSAQANERKSGDVKSGDVADISNNNAGKISFTGGGIPNAMVGSWTRSEGNLQVDSTGKTQYGGGAHFTYEFFTDGSVKYRMDKKLLTIMQCKIEERKSADGTAAVSGDTLNIELGETAFFSSNSCDDTKNFDKTLPAETVSLNWRFKTEYDVTRLCIDEKDGEMCYDRKD